MLQPGAFRPASEAVAEAEAAEAAVGIMSVEAGPAMAEADGDIKFTHKKSAYMTV